MKTKTTPRSEQRLKVLELFDDKPEINRFDVMDRAGLAEQVATKLLTAMWQDGQLNRELAGKSGAPGYVYTRIVLRHNPRLTMALRRRSNEQLGIVSQR
jgi:hypothetical protein